MEDLPLDRAPLEHRSLALSSWSRRAARRASATAGTTTSPSASEAIATISVTNSGFPPAARAIRLAEVGRNVSGISSSTASCDRGSRRQRDGPVGAALGQLGPGEAEEEERRAAREQRDMLDEVEEGLSPHWMSSKRQTSGACSSSSLRNAHAISSDEAPAAVSPSSGAERGRRRRIGGLGPELLQHLDDRPVRDPVPVGQTSAATTVRRPSRGTPPSSRDLPTPASPTTVTSSAALLVADGLARSLARLESPTARRRRTRGGARAPRVPQRAGRRARARPFPSARAARAGRLSTASRTSARVCRPIRISPGCAACSRRAATLTASPVASRSSVPVTTSPVSIPILACTPRSGSASRISVAARTARSASSSCT